VVDVHLIHERQVEFFEHDAIRDVPGERGMPVHHRDAARAPALVGRREGVRAADRERRHHVERERGGVVVVDEDHDIRALLRHPATRPFIAGKDRRPVRMRGAAAVERGADRRHMAGAEACGDPRHQ
jgi:hypothetical protein